MFSVDRRVWHFTRGENLARIFEAGCLRCDRDATPAVSVGNDRIKARRARRVVPVGPSGVVSDYVPFYFGPRRPMFLSVVKKGTDGWEHRQRSLVYVVSSPARLRDAGRPVVYSDRNAVLELATFTTDGSECPIAWDIIDCDDWAWVAQQDEWKALTQAELLAHDFVPSEAIELVGVLDQGVKRRVEAIMAEHGTSIPVQVAPTWYLR